MPREIVMRHRTPQFTHVFSGEGYAAGYYSYLWSDTLTADAWEAFTQAGGPWDNSVAERLRRDVFSVGNTIDPADGFRAFRGRDPDIGALMRKRGFPVPPAGGAAAPASGASSRRNTVMRQPGRPCATSRSRLAAARATTSPSIAVPSGPCCTR